MIKEILLFFCLIVFIVLEGKSQNYNSILFAKRQIVFSISPLLYQGYRHKNDLNNLISKPLATSLELKVSYVEKIKKNYYFTLGVVAGVVPSRTKYKFEAPVGSVFLSGTKDYQYKTLETDNSFKIDFYYGLPITLGRNFRFNENTLINVELGFKLNKLLNYPAVKTNIHVVFVDSINSVLLFNQELAINKKYFNSYLIKIGVQRQLNNQNVLGLGIVTNFVPIPIAEGKYEFYNLGFENSGSVTQSASFIGLEITYGLNLAKKRLKG